MKGPWPEERVDWSMAHDPRLNRLLAAFGEFVDWNGASHTAACSGDDDCVCPGPAIDIELLAALEELRQSDRCQCDHPVTFAGDAGGRVCSLCFKQRHANPPNQHP